jgi:hypothetical protein
MTATVVVQEVYGASPSFQTVSNRVRLFTADQVTNQVTPDTTYPVPIPAAGFNYSYWKHICLDVSSTFTSVGNIRHYSDGTIGWNFGSGGELRRGNRDAGDQGVAVDALNGHSSGYDQASGTPSTTGDTIETQHAFYSGQTTKVSSVASDTSGSPAVIESGSLTVAGKSKAIVLQVKVDTTANGASSGVQTAETLTWKYDVID